MVKYVLMSAVIVFGGAILGAGWANRDLIRIKIASVYARVAAKADGSSRLERGAAAPLSGDAPWALSALPECLMQISKSTGSASYVRAHLPPRAVPIVPPARLVYADCSIAIAGEEAVVRRGSDRLHIPPRVSFYRAAKLLATIREGAGSAELRVYRAVQP